jgi:hypothetical protein
MKPSERLKIAITHLQKVNPALTHQDILKEVDFKSPSHLSDMMAGKKAITKRFLNALEHKFLISKHWIETGEGQMYKQPALRITRPGNHYLEGLTELQQEAWLNHLSHKYAQLISMITDTHYQASLAQEYAELEAIFATKQNGNED